MPKQITVTIELTDEQIVLYAAMNRKKPEELTDADYAYLAEVIAQNRANAVAAISKIRDTINVFMEELPD